MNIRILILALMALLTLSCNRMKRVQDIKLLPQKTEDELFNSLVTNQVKADWLSAKIRLQFSDGNISESFSGSIRMKKDSVIWMNLTKFNFEGARIMLTPDSFYLIDRLNSQVFIKPFDYLQKTYNLPVNFVALQSLVLGNPVFFSKEFDVVNDSSNYVLMQRTERFESKYQLDPERFTLTLMTVQESTTQRKLSVQHSDFQKLKGKQKFSYFRTFNLSGPALGQMMLEIEFINVSLNVPQSLDFKIPSRYALVE